jgi:hypothetical protein
MFIGLQENPSSRETVSLTKAGEDEGTLPPSIPQKIFMSNKLGILFGLFMCKTN